MKKDFKNILVFNVNWLGDVVFSTPVFDALKEAYPDAKITCAAVPRVIPILKMISSIDEVVVYDEDNRHGGVVGKLGFAMELKAKKFDIVFHLNRSFSRVLLCWVAGIPIRVGYDEKARGRFLTHKFELPKNVLHRSDHYLGVIENFGIEVRNRQTCLTITEEASTSTKELLLSHNIKGHFIAVNPGGNWDLKRWPKANWRLLIEHLQLKGETVVLTGSDQDIVLAEEIISGLKIKPVILAGQTNLDQMVGVLKKAEILVSADSGPLHLASSVGTRTVSIFGPTRPEITGPRGNGKSIVLQHDVGCNAHACYYLDCPDNICMQAVTVQEVVDAIKEIKC